MCTCADVLSYDDCSVCFVSTMVFANINILRSDHFMLVTLFRFAVLASRMEQYIQGQSRDLIDKAYTKLVSITALPILHLFAFLVFHMY